MQFELFPWVYIVCNINYFRGCILSVILNYKEWKECILFHGDIKKKKTLITLLYETASRLHTVCLVFFSYLHETKKKKKIS